jgi:hypothetical protein
MTIFERVQMPSLHNATAWLNSEPLDPAELRGRVVLIDFWTLTCITVAQFATHASDSLPSGMSGVNPGRVAVNSRNAFDVCCDSERGI